MGISSKIVAIQNYQFPASLFGQLPTKTKGEIHRKGWGHEEWIWNDNRFCGKLLVFEPNKKCSYHYHLKKFEVFRVLRGKFIVAISWGDDLKEAEIVYLEAGEVLEIPIGMRHQMIASPQGGIIIEVSTEHFEDDSIKLEKGD